MRTALPLLVGTVLVVGSALLARRALRRRRGRARSSDADVRLELLGDLLLAFAGLVLAAGSLMAALQLLEVRQPPRGQLFGPGAGVATEVRPQPGRGFVLGMGVFFRGCRQPVEVKLVASGTADFFQAHADRLGRPVTVTVTVPDKGVRDLRVGYSLFGTDAVQPLDAKQLADGASLPRGSFTILPARQGLQVTAVRVRIARWAGHLVPIVVTFEADWLSERGLGSCYLKLPPLAGSATVLSAQDGRGRARATPGGLAPGTTFVSDPDRDLFAPLDESLQVVRGIAVVNPGRHDVVGDISQPQPDTQSSGVPAWSCRSVPKSEAVLRPGERSGADFLYGPERRTAVVPSMAAIEKLASEQRDCTAVVALAEADAGIKRDLLVLVAGAIFSLGATLIVEALLSQRSRREKRRERRRERDAVEPS